jgi:hypothetical protein
MGSRCTLAMKGNMLPEYHSLVEKGCLRLDPSQAPMDGIPVRTSCGMCMRSMDIYVLPTTPCFHTDTHPDGLRALSRTGGPDHHGRLEIIHLLDIPLSTSGLD